MPFYDIFNGDADGICALHQLRLEEPLTAQLVTGTKREIRLVERIEAGAGDELTVLDVSFDVNREGVLRALAAGARVRYIDHHFAGELPAHAGLSPNIDTSPDVCTALIVDRVIGGRRRAWAVVAAFGDNLHAEASAAAAPLGLAPHALAQLQELGECINYNAYGDSLEDLHYHPADLYRTLARYDDPFRFIAGEPVFEVLREGMADDAYRAGEIEPAGTSAHAIVVLPHAAWSRRVSGTLGNRLAQQHPQRAHAVLTPRSDGGFKVSVRAPLARPRGADSLCRQFETGGGRAAAGGIDRLPAADIERFARALAAAYPAPAA
jgi:hypothetical protein